MPSWIVTEDVQHSLMLRLLFYTGVRVSELCNIQVADVDLETCKIRVNQGKGSKDQGTFSSGEVVRNRSTNAHCRPPPQSMALPDQEGDQVLSQAESSRSSSTMPRKLASGRPRIPSATKPSLG